MRFNLQDVKKSVHRRSGELLVSPHFLRAGESRAEIARLVAYYEGLCEQPQKRFASDEARACIGDYRLANCLIPTLSAWYTWQGPDWQGVLERMGDRGEKARQILAEAAIHSPVHLRLALFSYVNEHYSGFLGAQARAEALQAFAAQYALETADLEYLLALDSDDEALLTRETPEPPHPDEVAALYNQWVFEAALCSASDVHFVIDCQAFLEMQRTEHEPGESATEMVGIGAVIKRLCYLARKLGVYYDLAYEDDGSNTAGSLLLGRGERSPSSADDKDAPEGRKERPLQKEAGILHLTLYGPQEMTGAPQQYGIRLARLCRMLLGFGARSAMQASAGTKRNRQTGVMLTKAIREAEATVYFLQRSYRFAMNSELLALLPAPETNQARGMERAANGTGAASSVFDSSIERSFAEAFAALARSQGADGWQLEREPEPLLIDTVSGQTRQQSLFIPDFALTRGRRRIYVEILGFWTPGYRERKIQKLQHLRERDDLVLALPVEARGAFAAIAADFPIVEYAGQLSATDLLRVLRSRYDDFEERLEQIDIPALRKRVEAGGLLPERACYEPLHCYRRSELTRAAAMVTGDGIAFTAGIGLYLVDWLEHLRNSFVKWLGDFGRIEQGKVHTIIPEGADSKIASTDNAPGAFQHSTIPLTEILRETRGRWPELAECEDATLEALIGLWPEVHIRRDSIFDAVVEVGHDIVIDMNMVDAEKGAVQAPAPKKVVRERRTAVKKRPVNEASQKDLWE